MKTWTLDNQKHGLRQVRRLVVSAGLIGVVAVIIEAGTLARQLKEDALPPPKPGLVAIHWPELNRLEPDVREHVSSLQKSLADLSRQSGASDSMLAEAYGLMGQVYHAYSLSGPAEECYVNAHRLAPLDFRWPHLLGDIYVKLARIDDAITQFSVARRLQPRYLAACVNLGNLHLQQNRLDEARASFADALEIDSACSAAHYGLGQIALSENRYTQAIEYLERALLQTPAANRIHYALAMAHRGRGDIDKARIHLELRGPVGIRVSDPLIDGLVRLIEGERLHLIRGRQAFEAGRFVEAEKEFRKALAAEPESVQARLNLGSSLAQLGDVSGALEQYRETLRVEPNNPGAHYNLGLLLARMNRNDESLAHLRMALQVNPGDQQARLLLARQLVRAKRLEEALVELNRVVEAEPEDEDALLELVSLLMRMQQNGRAIEVLERGHALFPKKGRTAATLAYVLAAGPRHELRDGARALDLARLIYNSTGVINHGAIVAMALAEMGRCREAADWQRQMISAAERDQREDLIEKLIVDLRRYEEDRPCRPASYPSSSPDK